jgi:valine--pyruvate aminotransferase
MKLTDFGRRYGGSSGTRQLMEDLGSALDGSLDVLMLGGGNPSHIPAVQELFRQRALQIASDASLFAQTVGNYDAPQGQRDFVAALVAMLNREYGWGLTTRNVALTHGSQSAFFLLFNMFAGPCSDGSAQRILLPMTPEYIGYADVGLTDDMFVACRPTIELLDCAQFKYHVDLQGLAVGPDIGAMCVSRPTNPTGNVLTDDEIDALIALARAANVPLIIDGAYGTPFPDIIYTEARPVWNEHIILCLSLSKIGLPGVRTGIVVAAEPVIDALTGMNAILTLSTGSVGPALVQKMVESGEILTISRDLVNPYYRGKAERALGWVNDLFAGCKYRVHRPEGAFFLWLWFEGLPVTSAELYQRLKSRGVVVLPGHHFFPGLREPWTHQHECIRVSYTQQDDIVHRGLAIIADEIRAISAGAAADDRKRQHG